MLSRRADCLVSSQSDSAVPTLHLSLGTVEWELETACSIQRPITLKPPLALLGCLQNTQTVCIISAACRGGGGGGGLGCKQHLSVRHWCNEAGGGVGQVWVPLPPARLLLIINQRHLSPAVVLLRRGATHWNASTCCSRASWLQLKGATRAAWHLSSGAHGQQVETKVAGLLHMARIQTHVINRTRLRRLKLETLAHQHRCQTGICV